MLIIFNEFKIFFSIKILYFRIEKFIKWFNIGIKIIIALFIVHNMFSIVNIYNSELKL